MAADDRAMNQNCWIEVKNLLPEEKIDKMLREVEDDNRLWCIDFIKDHYQGNTIPETTDREERSPATGGRWIKVWNESRFSESMRTSNTKSEPR